MQRRTPFATGSLQAALTSALTDSRGSPAGSSIRLGGDALKLRAGPRLVTSELTPLNLLRALALVGAAAVMMCTAPMAGTPSTPTNPAPARSAAAYLGVQAGDVSTGGAVVHNVAPGSPADSSRIQAGDIITAVNGHPVSDAAALQRAIATMAPRSTVSLTIYRNETAITVEVTLGTVPAF